MDFFINKFIPVAGFFINVFIAILTYKSMHPNKDDKILKYYKSILNTFITTKMRNIPKQNVFLMKIIHIEINVGS